MKTLIIIFILSFNVLIAQQNEEFQVYIVKITKLESGIKENKYIFIDSLGLVKTNMNNLKFHVNKAEFNKSVIDLLNNEKFEKHEADTYENRAMLISNLSGENINIFISKISDLRKNTIKNKTYYSLYKFYSGTEINLKKDVEVFLKKILKLDAFNEVINQIN